jgi:hypothetical protein
MINYFIDVDDDDDDYYYFINFVFDNIIKFIEIYVVIIKF